MIDLSKCSNSKISNKTRKNSTSQNAKSNLVFDFETTPKKGKKTTLFVPEKIPKTPPSEEYRVDDNLDENGELTQRIKKIRNFQVRVSKLRE